MDPWGTPDIPERWFDSAPSSTTAYMFSLIGSFESTLFWHCIKEIIPSFLAAFCVLHCGHLLALMHHHAGFTVQFAAVSQTCNKQPIQTCCLSYRDSCLHLCKSFPTLPQNHRTCNVAIYTCIIGPGKLCFFSPIILFFNSWKMCLLFS